MKIRILVPMDNKIKNEMIEQLKTLGIGIRDNRRPLLAKLTNLVVDNKFSLIVELKDGTREKTRRRNEEAIGLATYSNSESTVSSFVSIFKTLCIQKK